MVNQLDNFLSVGQLVQKCKDDIRSTLFGLKALYHPCTIINIHEFTGDLIEVLNRVIADFIDENQPEEIPPENDENSTIKSEIHPDNIITIESDDETNVKEEDWLLIEPEEIQFDRHSESFADTQLSNGSQSNVLAQPMAILEKKTKSKKRRLEKSELIQPNCSKKPRASVRGTKLAHVCEICSKRVHSAARLTYHRKQHLEESSINCQICLQFFSSNQERIVHESECNQIRYDCYACGMVGECLSQLKTHFRCHLLVRPYKCKKCPKCYTTKNLLRGHIKKAHQIAAKKSIIIGGK